MTTPTTTNPADFGPAVLAALNQAFSSRAEQHESASIHSLFASGTHINLTELQRRDHHVIVGRMGTGKTMVLIYLSASSQSHCTLPDGRLGFVGVYLGISHAWLREVRFRREDSQARSLFERWFSLFVAECSIRELQTLSPPMRAKVDTTSFATRILQHISGPIDVPDLDTILRQLADLREQLASAISRPTLKHDDLLARLDHKLAPTQFLPYLAACLSKSVADIAAATAPIFFLVDQFDQCSPEQQDVIAQLMATAGSRATYFAKLACRRETGQRLAGIQPQDYRVLPLDLPLGPLPSHYRDFCGRVLALRLRAIASILREHSVSEEVVRVFDQPEALLGDATFEHQLAYYSAKKELRDLSAPLTGDSGIDAFRRLNENTLRIRYCGRTLLQDLSGGFIRNFVDLLYQILRAGAEGLQYPSNITNSVPLIRTQVQDEAVRAEVKSTMNVRLKSMLNTATWTEGDDGHSAIDHESVGRFLRGLVRNFRAQVASTVRSPANLVFSLEVDLHDPESGEVLQVLRLLYDLGYISGDLNQAHPRLSVSPYLCPWLYDERLELPTSAAGCLRLSRADTERLTTPFDSTAGHRVLLTVFYAASWRTDEERALRRLLTAKDSDFLRRVVAKIGIKLFLAGDEPSTHDALLWQQVRSSIEKCNFVLAYITGANPNVAFELGLARACRKRTYHMADWDKLTGMGRSLRYLGFIKGRQAFPLVLVRETAPKENVVLEAIDRVFAFHKNQRKAQALRRRPARLQRTMRAQLRLYLHLPESSPRIPDRAGIVARIRDLRVVPLEAGLEHGRDEFTQHADLIDEATHVVIDLTGMDEFACLLYGYALGRGRAVLPIAERGQEAVFSDIQGLPDPARYTDAESLCEGIIKPWLLGREAT